MPETKAVRLNPDELAEQATARAEQLIEVTLAHSEHEVTDEERRLVKLGVDLGITVTISALKAHASTDSPSGHH